MAEFVEVQSDKMYLVSNEGNVYSLFTNRLLKPSLSKGTGYYVVNIRKDGSRKPEYVHRLVAEAFIPNPLNLAEVNHKDGNKLNNASSNLEWVTGNENKIHAKETGLIKKGVELERSTLTSEQVHEICRLFASHYTTGQILKLVDFNTNRSQLLNIRARRDWQHISCEYYWPAFSSRRNSKAK